jgi:hypothetical protein
VEADDDRLDELQAKHVCRLSGSDDAFYATLDVV